MAFNGILYRKSGGTLELNRSVGSFCVVESAKLEDKWQDGGVVTLVLQTTEVLTFYSGDYIIARGNRYLVCKTISEYTTLDDGKHQYTIPLESPDALFKNALMYNTVEIEDGGVYSWSRPNNFIMELGSVETLVKACCYNVNEVMGRRVFKLGTIDASVSDEYRVINFSDNNCWAGLKQTCEHFDTFYTIRANTDETPDSDYIVDIGVEPGTFPETLQVGMRQGIAELTMNYADEDVYTQFVVLGSSENLPRGYEHERLQLDEDLMGTPPVYAGSLIVDESKYARWGRKRMELIFDDIKPTRTGTITSIPEDNIFAFYDTSLSEVLAVEENWNPVGGTVHILDGNLLGYTFEIIAFHSGTYKITIKQISDSNGLLLPNADNETFRFSTGMKYNLAGIALPNSYVVDAKTRLKAAAVNAINGYWTQPRASFSLTPDPFFLREKDTDISCGWLIPIKHDALEIDKSIRVTSVTYDLLKDTYFDIDSVEVADITGKDNFMNSVHKSTQRSLNMLRDQGIINSHTAKESNMVALLNRIALSLHLPNWETLLEMLGTDKGLFTMINEEGEDIHVVNADLLRAGTALVNSLFTNEVFIAGLPDAMPAESLLVDENGMIDFTATTSGGEAGLYVDSTKLGYWDGTAWKTYLANNGDFYLAGATAENYLTWISATDTLTVKGAIHALSGSIGGLTIAADKVYLGDGVYGGATTPFYVDDDGQMSLKDKFKWDGTNLTINGGGTFTGKISVGGVLIGKDALGSGLHGIKLNDYNYWYLDGENAKVKFGGETNYISWDGTTLKQNGAAIGGGSIVGTSIDIPNATTPLFKVTGDGIITAKSGTIGALKISATQAFLGTGAYNNANTPFYVDTSNRFSLGSKLTFSSAGELTINGGGTFSGALSAATGSFAGSLSAASGTFAGTVAIGETLKIGASVNGANNGLFINSNNYWYDSGALKIGSATSYLSYSGGNLSMFGGAFSASDGTTTVSVSDSAVNNACGVYLSGGNQTASLAYRSPSNYLSLEFTGNSRSSQVTTDWFSMYANDGTSYIRLSAAQPLGIYWGLEISRSGQSAYLYVDSVPTLSLSGTTYDTILNDTSLSIANAGAYLSSSKLKVSNLPSTTQSSGEFWKDSKGHVLIGSASAYSASDVGALPDDTIQYFTQTAWDNLTTVQKNAIKLAIVY